MPAVRTRYFAPDWTNEAGRGAIFLPLAQGLCYSRRMIRRLSFWLIAVVFGAWLESRSVAATFKLADGGELTGEPIAFGRDGVAVKKPDGSFSAKVAWTNFTQDALQQLATLPRAKPFVDPLLEPDVPEPSRKAAPQLKLKPIPRLDRPDPPPR